MGILSFLGLGKEVKDAAEGISSLYTTDAERLELHNKMLTTLAEIDKKQAEINAIYAQKNTSKLDWRNLCGYICTIALAMQYIIVPLAQFVLSIFNIDSKIPTLQIADLVGLLAGMLGLGALHTIRKF